MARRFADAVLEAVTGTKGPFDSKLAFVSTRRGRFKEIFTQTIDGEDLFQVTNNPTINLFPMWDHNADQLLYLSFKSMAPALYIANLREQREVRIPTHHGRAIGGAISPDGHQIVAAIENGGETNLYLMDADGNEIAPVDRYHGYQCEPEFFARWTNTRVHLGSIRHAANLYDEYLGRIGEARDVFGKLQHHAGDLAQGRQHRVPESRGRPFRHLSNSDRRRNSGDADRWKRL